jgi:hypothetical protein
MEIVSELTWILHKNEEGVCSKWHDFESNGLDFPAKTQDHGAGIDTQQAGTGMSK